jgi:predicted small metal-binding protein
MSTGMGPGLLSPPCGDIERIRVSTLQRRGLFMARELRCADLVPGCNFVAQGARDSGVMRQAAEHAKSAHKRAAIAMEVEKKARASIRDVAA